MPSAAPTGQNKRPAASPLYSSGINSHRKYEYEFAKPPSELGRLTGQEQGQWIESIKKTFDLKEAVYFILSSAPWLKQEIFEDFLTSVLNIPHSMADRVLIERSVTTLLKPQQEMLVKKIIPANANVNDLPDYKVLQMIYLGNHHIDARGPIINFLNKAIDSLSADSFKRFMRILHHPKLDRAWKYKLLDVLNSRRHKGAEFLPPPLEQQAGPLTHATGERSTNEVTQSLSKLNVAPHVRLSKRQRPYNSSSAE